MSSSAIPDHLVAQNAKPCSAAIALTLPAPTSLSLPSSPCPYSAGRAALVNADFGISHWKATSWRLPGSRDGSPSAPYRNAEPGGPPGWSR